MYVVQPGTFKEDLILSRLANRLSFEFILSNNKLKKKKKSEMNKAKDLKDLDPFSDNKFLTQSDVFLMDRLNNAENLGLTDIQLTKSSSFQSEIIEESPPKAREGIFQMLTKGFKKESKVFKLFWKKESVLSIFAKDLRTLEQNQIHFFEKNSLLKSLVETIYGKLEVESNEESALISGSSQSIPLAVSNDLAHLMEPFFSEIESFIQMTEKSGVIILNQGNTSQGLQINSATQKSKDEFFKYKSIFSDPEKDSLNKKRNENAINNYQQVLGTLSFGFQNHLTNSFHRHYRMAKSNFSALKRFSLVEKKQNLLQKIVQKSLNQDFGEFRQLDTYSLNNLPNPDENLEHDSKIIEEIPQDKELTSFQPEPKSKDSSKDLESQSKESVNSRVFSKTSLIKDKEKLNPSSPNPPRVLVKQDKTTVTNFQRPFVKAKTQFDLVSDNFPYKMLLGKKGRNFLSEKFKNKYNIIHKINSYLKAFYEMEKFSEGSDPVVSHKSKRRRRTLHQTRSLPFSSALYYAKFKKCPYFGCFIIKAFMSLPCLVLFEGNKFSVVLSELVRSRKIHLELKQIEFKLTKGMRKVYFVKDIFKVFEYKFLHNRQACHILFKNNRSLILHFETKKKKKQFMKMILAQSATVADKNLSCQEELKRQDLRNLWAHSNRLSNFSLISFLNLLGSRSLEDFSQYPVFPLVISKICNKTITYRDMSKPIGMIGDANKVRLLSQKYVKSDNFDNILPYFYGSHYSSPATTFHFLLRMKPFEKGAKSIQNGKFDLPDRLFHSIDNVIDNINKETSDVRELPPELYYQPLFLINVNDLNFGVNQSGTRVDHVLTPPLMGKSPFRFIYSMRKELESERVSKGLSKWIDLIFGYKQLGTEAIKNKNVFFYLTYQNSERFLINAKEKDKEALETQVFHFGQVPFQLTDSPWPEKKFMDLSVVSHQFTKKYFVKKLFEQKISGLNNTCEFCFEKIVFEDKPEDQVNEICDACHLCRECSNKQILSSSGSLISKPSNISPNIRRNSLLKSRKLSIRRGSEDQVFEFKSINPSMLRGKSKLEHSNNNHFFNFRSNQYKKSQDFSNLMMGSQLFLSQLNTPRQRPSIKNLSRSSISFKKSSFEEDSCYFCQQRALEMEEANQRTGAAHENMILLMKEQSVMDLTRKYISKISVIRPFRIDYYTFILFKSDKLIKIHKSDEEGPIPNILGNLGESFSNDADNKGLSDSEKKLKDAGNAYRMKSSPFELNLNKSVSLEKLKLEMKRWNLVGARNGLWTIKNSFELYKDMLFFGGCTKGYLRIFSIKKQKTIFQKHFHKYLIKEITISKCGKILTLDQSGIVKISNVIDKGVHISLEVIFCSFSGYGSKLSHVKFPNDQSQLFFYIQNNSKDFRLQVFDSENKAKKVIDLYQNYLPLEMTNQSRNSQLKSNNVNNIKIEFIDLSFGFLNCIVIVRRNIHTNQYIISTCTFEGVPLTQFTLFMPGKKDILFSFVLFKDSFFKDHLACISQKGTSILYQFTIQLP